MRKTDFLKLHLPDENEYYNVELDQNQNFIRVDGKLKEHNTALTTIQQGATNSQKGIVQFGIEEGKALEGNMLARLAGAYGFGGDIQNPGVKNQNYIYYDNNTRKMYKCLNQNSDTSANVQNYVPIDNFSILERLENLSRKDVTLNVNIPKSLQELNNLGDTILNNTLSLDNPVGITTIRVKCQNGSFILRITKTYAFYLYEAFLQINKYFISNWSSGSNLVFIEK